MVASKQCTHEDVGEDEAIRSRIRAAIDSKSLKLSEFSKQSGIPYPTLREYYNGLRKPGFEAVANLLSFTGVSGDWLLLGKGEMYTPASIIDDREGLLGQIAQEVESAFSVINGVVNTDGDADEGYLSTEHRRELRHVGKRTVIAATIYRDVASLKDDHLRRDRIRSEARRYAQFQRSLEATELQDVT